MLHRLVLFLILSGLVGSTGFAQVSSNDDAPSPVKLVTVSTPESLAAGSVGHFRVQVTEQTTQPVNYLWDLGDGTMSLGSPISHAYRTPGRYTVTVVARNTAGRDTLRANVEVRSRETVPEVSDVASRVQRVPRTVEPVSKPPSEPRRSAPVRVSRSALYGAGGIAPEDGGYTWVIESDLWAERAQSRVLRYRLQGLRADLLVDSTGVGSPAYRVVVGQVASDGEALALRPWLPGPSGAWLMDLREWATKSERP